MSSSVVLLGRSFFFFTLLLPLPLICSYFLTFPSHHSACELAAEELEERAQQLKRTRDKIFQQLSSSLPPDSFHVNTNFPCALPNTLSLWFFFHILSFSFIVHFSSLPLPCFVTLDLLHFLTPFLVFEMFIQER